MYAAVRVAQAARRWCAWQAVYRPIPAAAWSWYVLFGVAFGMALASKINLLPLGGMILIAAFISIADLKLQLPQDLSASAGLAGLLLLWPAAGQPADLPRDAADELPRAVQGDTTLLTLYLNPDWIESMSVAQPNSSGIGGGPPAEQWANRPAILFPLMNMVVWGMGLPLGLAVWAGFLAGPLAGASPRRELARPPAAAGLDGGYFLLMGTRWVSSVRYFPAHLSFPVPVGGLGLLMWQRGAAWRRRLARSILRRGPFGRFRSLVVGGTFTWATAFTQTVFGQDHTRIQATKWIYQNIPAPFDLGD